VTSIVVRAARPRLLALLAHELESSRYYPDYFLNKVKAKKRTDASRSFL